MWGSDWMGLYPGGVRYRASKGAINHTPTFNFGSPSHKITILLFFFRETQVLECARGMTVKICLLSQALVSSHKAWSPKQRGFSRQIFSTYLILTYLNFTYLNLASNLNSWPLPTLKVVFISPNLRCKAESCSNITLKEIFIVAALINWSYLRKY